MHVWRILLSLTDELWTCVVAAPDHEVAWRLAVAAVPGERRERPFLEELEATGERAPEGGARVLVAWPGGEPLRRPAA